MGDVCGKGTEAAKVTALARYTLRADAGDHLSPAAVLTRLNAAMLAQQAPLFLTAVQATFRLDPGRAVRAAVPGRAPAGADPPGRRPGSAGRRHRALLGYIAVYSA